MVTIILAAVIVILVIIVAVVLYNLVLLINELNKRLIYIITDVLQGIDLSTPHLDTLNPDEPDTINLEDLLKDTTEESYFNPHDVGEE